MIHRQASGWRTLTLAWNVFALLDLVLAVSLGIGSAPNSPFRFIYEQADTGTVGSLPWTLIPGFFVPLYVLTHVAIFYQLTRMSLPGSRAAARA